MHTSCCSAAVNPSRTIAADKKQVMSTIAADKNQVMCTPVAPSLPESQPKSESQHQKVNTREKVTSLDTPVAGSVRRHRCRQDTGQVSTEDPPVHNL